MEIEMPNIIRCTSLCLSVLVLSFPFYTHINKNRAENTLPCLPFVYALDGILYVFYCAAFALRRTEIILFVAKIIRYSSSNSYGFSDSQTALMGIYISDICLSVHFFLLPCISFLFCLFVHFFFLCLIYCVGCT